MHTVDEQEAKWAHEKHVCLIAHKMKQTPRHLWSGTFEILSEGTEDKFKLKNDVWKVMQQ